LKTYQEHLSLFLNHLAQTKYGENPKELYEPIEYMMQLGGKRLRPILCLMGYELFDSKTESALPAALAIEVFHNFTLVHDDIMDNAPLRRGKATVYQKWNMPVAILVGDLMMIKAVDFIRESQSKQINEMLTVFLATAREVCEGQQLDMNFETQVQVSLDAYIEMITLKTAVLIGASLKIGALAANASLADANHLYEFGKNIGIAFQIQDDLLDCFGNDSNTGKQVGGDIAANKKTLLYIELLSSVHKDDRTLLDTLSSEQNMEIKIQETLKLYKKYQIKAFAEQQKQQYLDRAMQHLYSVAVEPEILEVLKETALGLMERIA
jgi:geranylgeranyl diphosphate synthase type II